MTYMSMDLPEKLSQAYLCFNARDLAGTERLCSEILRAAPQNPDALHLLGVVRLIGGNPHAAAPLIRRALEANPEDTAMLENLGVAHLAAREHAKAEAVFLQALGLGASGAVLHMRLGLALGGQGKLAEAASSLSTAASMAPTNPDVQLNLGNLLAEQGQTEGALACYNRVLALQPDHVIARFNLGNVYRLTGRLEEAAAAFKDALRLAPNDPDVHNNLGLVYGQQQRFDDEMSCYRRALELDPGHLQALNNLGNALCALGKPGEAVACFQRALKLDSGRVSLYRDLGGAYLQAADLDAAAACYRKAMKIDPRDAQTCYGLAEVLKLQGRLDEAIAGYEQARALQPGHLLALNGLIHVRQHACSWDGIELLWERLRSGMTGSADAVATPFSTLSMPTTPAEQLACAGTWARQNVAQLAAPGLLAFDFAARQPRGKLRVGYLSWGLHRHATAHLVAELFELHDRDRFEIYAYDYGPDDQSAVRARIRDACSHFADISVESHVGAARRIYGDSVDILVDLTGYTLGARTQILALRPAPVQASWLGYPGTMGTDCVDYLIADPYILPPGSERYYTEKVIRLPDCYQITDRKREVSGRTPTREEYGLPAQAFVFCCFNQAYKILPEMFGAWMRILQAVPGSVLWLAEANRWQPENLRREAAARGVAGERLVFTPRKPLAEYMAQYRIADFALDTYPYTSHTTASDALWMGCPLATCAGETFASRVAGSVLINAGMRELVTGSLGDYERLVVELATSPGRLQDVRRRLEESRESCPLFDTPRFVRNLERAYETMFAAQAGGKG